MNARQFRIFVVRDTLRYLDLWSVAAEDLLVGTALHESGGLQFIDQVTGPGDETFGPAYGLFQIEPATHRDLFENFLAFKPRLETALLKLAAPWPARDLQLASNLVYAAAVCRMIYYRRPEPLPAAGDIDGYAAFWKTHYNTRAGQGDPAAWARRYRAAHEVVRSARASPPRA